MKINSGETSGPRVEINEDHYLQTKQDIEGIYSKYHYYKKRRKKKKKSCRNTHFEKD